MPLKDLSRTLSSDEDLLLRKVAIRMLEKVELHVYIYNEYSYFKEKCSNVTEVISVIQGNRSAQCVWIEVSGPIGKRHDVVKQLGVHFGLHLLTLEDIQTVEEKTKLEIFDDGIYLVMKMLYVHEHNLTNMEQQQISFYLKDNLLITFQEQRTSLFLPIKQRLANNRGRLTKLKSDYLFYCLMNIIIENYMIVLHSIGLKIGDIDAELMQMTSLKSDTLKLIYKIKHDMLHFRIMCAPLKNIIIKLQKSHDRLPRRDPFAVPTAGPKPPKKKRGRRRRISRQTPVNTLQPIKTRGESLSPAQTNRLQPIKSRGQSVSPTRSINARTKRSRQSLSNDDGIILNEYIFMYFKNLHDQILQTNDTIETYSEMINWLVHFYMALNEYDLHQKMRLLTMVHAVFYPMLVIHGLNSMNFDWVPQRDDYDNSYFIFLGILVLIASSLLTWFKIKKWI
jgi:Mg2+ and Co2+ transporter CorA